MIRYRFSDFTLSPQRRLLVREGREVPLIPRYFDLLVLLIERRHEAVHRREIFDLVWRDVIVSDSALSQAIRTIRRALGDDSREPRFIRTVSRHGYRFVLDVVEEEDDVAGPAALPDVPASAAETAVASVEPPLERVRWIVASAGGALAGIAAGAFGGLVLAAAPGSAAPIAIAPVLAMIGGVCGALGGAGVGGGLSVAEAAEGSRRAVALIGAAALGGGLVGTAVQWLARWGLAALLGLDLEVGGALEGVTIGGAAGAGYAIATRTSEALMAAPRGRSRLRPAFIVAVLCGLAGLALALAGRPLVGGTIHAIAGAAEGSRATLAPLGRLIGERDFGPVSSALLAFGEAATFGLGLGYGLMRRPPSGRVA
ncbi:MAG: transcriptional regulator [Acidobacteria bacterium]|nr:transcriptional regulator [Acidobacteriota bacterium]